MLRDGKNDDKDPSVRFEQIDITEGYQTAYRKYLKKMELLSLIR